MLGLPVMGYGFHHCPIRGQSLRRGQLGQLNSDEAQNLYNYVRDLDPMSIKISHDSITLRGFY